MASLFAGSLIKTVLGLPVPDTVYAMVILFILLLSGFIKYDSIKDVAGILLGMMAMFFIPPAVGLVNTYHLVADKVVPFLIIVVVSTFLTFISTGLTVKFLVGRKDDQ